MWIFTTGGMISAVVDSKAGNVDVLIIRARDRQSLRDLSMFASEKIIDNEGTDYPFRVRIHRDVFRRWMVKQVDELEYTNYKSAAGKKRDSKFTGVLHTVWSTLLSLEPKRERKAYPWEKKGRNVTMFGSSPAYHGTAGKKTGKRPGQIFGDDELGWPEPDLEDLRDIEDEHRSYLESMSYREVPASDVVQVEKPLTWWEDAQSTGRYRS